MIGYVETKKTLVLDKEANNIYNDFKNLIYDMVANGCEEAETFIYAIENFESQFDEQRVDK